MRTLTMNDLSVANQMTADEQQANAAPVLAALRAIPGDFHDGAGMAIRGGDVYLAVLDNRFTAAQLAAAYQILRQQGVYRVLIDALESASVADPRDMNIDKELLAKQISFLSDVVQDLADGRTYTLDPQDLEYLEGIENLLYAIQDS